MSPHATAPRYGDMLLHSDPWFGHHVSRDRILLCRRM